MSDIVERLRDAPHDLNPVLKQEAASEIERLRIKVTMLERLTNEEVGNVPDDSWGAFGYLVSRCASGLFKELVEQGDPETKARNSIIHSFLDMAAGEACRVARGEGREPNYDKWLKATDSAFHRAVKRTEKSQQAEPASRASHYS